MDRAAAKSPHARGSESLNSPRAERIGAALFVSALVAFSAWYLAPSLSRAWFYRSDEYVVIGEVLRFLHLDFRQHYFDMPDTPLMFASAAVWGVIYAVAGHGAGVDRFTLHHLPMLFGMVRAASFVTGLLAIVLVFLLASKVTNLAGGCVAAMVVAMCPIYAWTESTIRPEPPVICLFVLAIFSLQRAFAEDARGSAGRMPSGTPTVRVCVKGGADPRRDRQGLSPTLRLQRDRPALPVTAGWSPDFLHRLVREGSTSSRLDHRTKWILVSGVLAGLAAALRFHSITATLPVLLMILLWEPVAPSRWDRVSRRIWAGACAVAILGMIGIRTGILPATGAGKMLATWWPKAFDAFFALCAIAAALILVIWALQFSTRAKWISERILHPRVLVLLSGAALGVLAGTPTILWRAQNFFESIQMYTTSYTDVERMSWPVTRHMAWLFGFFMKAIATDWLTLGLIAVGAVLIIIRRDRRLLPFLIGALLFFVSRPINTAPWPHQMLPWLPLFAIVAGYAVAVAWDGLSNVRLRPVALAGFLAAMAIAMDWGPRSTAADAGKDEQRMQNIALATDWIHGHAEPDSEIAISYYCFNSDVFFRWIQFLDVPLPPSTDSRRYLIWWGDHSALKGQKGYACATPQDVDVIKRKLDLRTPGEGSDPFRDPGFEHAAVFGSNASEVDVFRFDFSGRPAK